MLLNNPFGVLLAVLLAGVVSRAVFTVLEIAESLAMRRQHERAAASRAGEERTQVPVDLGAAQPPVIDHRPAVAPATGSVRLGA